MMAYPIFMGAADKWDSARFMSIFLASGLYSPQAESSPAHLRVRKPFERTLKEIFLNQLDDAYSIRNKNIIDMAITFSAMNRVFKKGSKQKIAEKLESSFSLLAGIDSKGKFEKIHSEFCEWFVKNIFTSNKVLKNKKSQATSYGQAAKIFNVALKVYAYYCHLPDYESAAKLLPMLHAAVDTLMMKNLGKKYPKKNIKAKTIKAVGESDYITLQKLVKKHIEDEFDNQIMPVQYDDILWYRLNKRA